MIFHKHHIVPVHMGGTDEQSNLLRCNIPMHAYLHYCLWVKFGKLQDKLAWLMLSGKSEEAERVRVEIMRSPEYRAKMSAVMTGKLRTTEHRQNLSKSLTGKHPSAATRQKMALAKIGNTLRTGQQHTNATRQRMSEAWKTKRQPLSRGRDGRILRKSVAGG